MLQIKLVPYKNQTDFEDAEYVFTENLNATIKNLENNCGKVIDIDFFHADTISYAAIKYDSEN